MSAASIVIHKYHLLAKNPISVGIFAACLLVIPIFFPAGMAQVVIGAHPGTLYFTIGDVYMDGQPVHTAGQNHPLLKEGQIVRTGYGRVEILLAPAVFLRLGEWGALRLVSRNPEDTQIELQKGSALVEVVQMAKGNKIGALYATTRVEFKRMGVYRLDMDPPRLRVFGGKAEVSSAERKVRLGQGTVANLGRAFSVSKFSPKDSDALHLWAARRSLFLYTSNPDAIATQTHWEINASGRSLNRDFHIRLYSPELAMEFAQRQILQEADEAKFQQSLDYLKNLDRENSYKTMREIQEQKQREREQGGQR